MTKESLEKATFAGGCFWCMVKPFDTQPGIEKVFSVIRVVIRLIQPIKKFAAGQQDIQKQSKSHLIRQFFHMRN